MASYLTIGTSLSETLRVLHRFGSPVLLQEASDCTVSWQLYEHRRSGDTLCMINNYGVGANRVYLSKGWTIA